MPNKVSSFPDFMAYWDRLLMAVRNNQASLPDLSGLVGPLNALLNEARELEADKAEARSLLSQAAKRTRTLMPEGRAAAARLRDALKVHFGGHNEALVQFGVAPLRTRRAPKPADPAPPSPPIPVPTPE
jgi:hypothetical protein